MYNLALVLVEIVKRTAWDCCKSPLCKQLFCPRPLSTKINASTGSGVLQKPHAPIFPTSGWGGRTIELDFCHLDEWEALVFIHKFRSVIFKVANRGNKIGLVSTEGRDLTKIHHKAQLSHHMRLAPQCTAITRGYYHPFSLGKNPLKLLQKESK